MMNLFGSTENKINKSKSDENVLHLEINEVVLVYCNIVNNDYQLDSRVLLNFVLNKSFGQLLNISPQNFIFLRIFNLDFSCIEVRLQNIDQNCEVLEVEDKISIN